MQILPPTSCNESLCPYKLREVEITCSGDQSQISHDISAF